MLVHACERCPEKAFVVIKERFPLSGFPDVKLCYGCALKEIRIRQTAASTRAMKSRGIM